jgi:hypothetical protein
MVTHPGPESAHLPRAIAEAIEVQARGESPLEACGLIAGSAPADEGGLALRYVPCRNSAASADRYTIHEDDMLRVTILQPLLQPFPSDLRVKWVVFQIAHLGRFVRTVQ